MFSKLRFAIDFLRPAAESVDDLYYDTNPKFKCGQSIWHLLTLAMLATAWILLSCEARSQMVAIDFPASVSAMQATAPGKCLLIGGHTCAEFDLESLTITRKHEYEDIVFSSIAYLDDGQMALGGAADVDSGFVGLSTTDSLPDFKWKVTDLEHPVTGICVTPQWVIAGNDIGQVAAFDIRDGQEVWRQQTHSKLVTCLNYLSNELCISSDWVGKIVLFNPTTGVELSNFQQHRERVIALESTDISSPPRLFSASRDGTVRLWYPTQRRLVRFTQLEEPLTALCVISESLAVVATRDAHIHSIDMNTAKIVDDQPSGLGYVTHLTAIDETLVLAVDGRGQLVKIRITGNQTLK